MTASHTIPGIRESDLARLAEDIAFATRPGDVIALRGDLGAGKTTLARAIIHALGCDEREEIPSPTFTLVQTYATRRMPVAHFDLYRLNAASEIEELGLDLALKRGIALIEWPERASSTLPASRLEILLEDESGGSAREESATRRVSLVGEGDWATRLPRLVAMRKLMTAGGLESEASRLGYLQGDASVRRYARITRAPRRRRHPDGLGAPARRPRDPQRTALQPHRASRRGRAPVRSSGRCAPCPRPKRAGRSMRRTSIAAFCSSRIWATACSDTRLRPARPIRRCCGARRPRRWQRSPSSFLRLCFPSATAPSIACPRTTAARCRSRPSCCSTGIGRRCMGRPCPTTPAPNSCRNGALCSTASPRCPSGWVLRDYHSPNLLWLPEREGIARVGVIDFQDAMRGPPAYDLVSLLQDARVDVAPELEAAVFDHYCAAVTARQTGFDRDAFAFAYAALGAQRNTKILGIFARLAKRDGKPAYLRHVPRLWRYLERDLAHPDLAGLKRWYDRCFPAEARGHAFA